ncbi:hypothetical protein LTR78_007961 [Recurvomyces mirabilis]|uniref:NADH-cytochrome b5 reductase 2 n=1 Tax=Recurvomyces mirabilis TaxID=574656 RepID=A0AAE0TRY3_9PEZI|nr:hypothetical protein LTR78_007961 [Recurvomyces mirabilis]KAK5152497.1 hypothetical protein LTS14_008444 [Recurvomyces mirabilis]
MAVPFTSRSTRYIPYLLSFAAVSVAAGTYYTRQPRISLDSARNAPKPALSFPGSMLFPKTLTVTKTEQINHDTKKITFRLPDGEVSVSGVPAGSAILTSHQPADGWLPVFRPYTPVSDPEERGTLQLLVKQYPNGCASTHLHSLTPGSTLTVRGPIPAYSYSSSSTPRDLVMIAGVNGTSDIVLKDELEGLEKQFPEGVQVTYCVSGPESKAEAADLSGRGRYRKGYINSEVVKEAVERVKQGGGWGDSKGTKVFICGPPAMQEAIAGKKGILGGEYGLVKKEIHMF